MKGRDQHSPLYFPSRIVFFSSFFKQQDIPQVGLNCFYSASMLAFELLWKVLGWGRGQCDLPYPTHTPGSGPSTSDMSPQKTTCAALCSVLKHTLGFGPSPARWHTELASTPALP